MPCPAHINLQYKAIRVLLPCMKIQNRSKDTRSIYIWEFNIIKKAVFQAIFKNRNIQYNWC